MAPTSLCVVLFLLLCSPAAFSQAVSPPHFTIRDRGSDQTFELATDELYWEGSAAPIQKIAPQASTDGIRALARTRRNDGKAPLPILYLAGEPRSEWSRRIVTKKITVKLRPGADPARIAGAAGMRDLGPAAGMADLRIFEAADPIAALEAAAPLAAQPEVEIVEPLLKRQLSKRLTPNDPFYGSQWHLKNTGQGGGLAGVDANVSLVWDTRKGDGIKIAIVDDGLQLMHPDLAPNIDPTIDHDWNDSTPNDPSPDLNYDAHGTACAGVAAARGNNGLGVSGAAPNATIVGLRLIAGPTDDADESEAVAWRTDVIQIKSNSWGPYDDATRLEGPGTLAQAALENATRNGRGGRGSVLLWAGGNGNGRGDNSNYDGWANSIYVIGVAALNNQGRQASYSEPGANLALTAPSSAGSLDIMTTDLLGADGYNPGGFAGEASSSDYTNSFGGTSSATPLVAGVTALMLQANPQLGWRDVKEILMKSAVKVDPFNGDWIVNSGGFNFNHRYGAGCVDARKAVELAATWTNLPAMTNAAQTQSSLNLTIPDNLADGIVRSFDFNNSSLRVESVTVRVDISHEDRGQLEVTLISPNGTQSRLAERHGDSNNHYANWTFSTVRNWGEHSQGVWRLKVADRGSGTVGRLNSATVTVYGTPATNLPRPPVITSSSLSPAGSAFPDQTLSISSLIAADPEGANIAYAYEWQASTGNDAYTSIAGATSTTFVPSSQVGMLVRCKITPSARSLTGAPSFTNAVAISSRPPALARHTSPLNYDANLYVNASGPQFPRALIFNEFSQGATSGQNWVEFLVLKNSDLRGYTFGDRDGTLVTFSQHSIWSDVPGGTLIVLYNGNSGKKDGLLPAVDFDPVGGTMVLPHNHAQAFLSGAVWREFSTATVEDLTVKDASKAIVESLSFNGSTIYEPRLAFVTGGRAAAFRGGSEPEADESSHWTLGIAAGAATPGAPNEAVGLPNATLVDYLRSVSTTYTPYYRFGAASEAVAGLSINSKTGDLSGTINVPPGGVFNIIIERVSGAEVTSQTFSLLVTTTTNSGSIAAGKTWTLSRPVTVGANLNVNGALNTNGSNLTVTGKLTIGASASVNNAAGSITYTNLSGAFPPGVVYLAINAANDALDLDGDGLSSLVEHALGQDPSRAHRGGLPTVARINGAAESTFRFPAGALGVVRHFEVSNDLVEWHSGPGYTEVVSDTTNAGGLRTVIIRDLTSGGFHYSRLRVDR